MPVETIEILGVRVHPVTVEELHTAIDRYIRANAHALVLNVNAHCLNLAYEHPWLREFLNQSDLVFCDGAGVQLAARLYGGTIPVRITYADWMWELASFCAQTGYTFFLLGGRPGIAEKAAAQLRARNPALKIIGVHHGYFEKEPSSADNTRVIAMINCATPNVLIVGFGMPLQEKWLRENQHLLRANVILTGGAVFDYVSGELKRGPQYLTNHGFEWLARLLIEPKRLWKRYVIGNPLFLWRVLMHRIGLLKL